MFKKTGVIPIDASWRCSTICMQSTEDICKMLRGHDPECLKVPLTLLGAARVQTPARSAFSLLRASELRAQTWMPQSLGLFRIWSFGSAY